MSNFIKTLTVRSDKVNY